MLGIALDIARGIVIRISEGIAPRIFLGKGPCIEPSIDIGIKLRIAPRKHPT